jgi:hypothetical protein
VSIDRRYDITYTPEGSVNDEVQLVPSSWFVQEFFALPVHLQERVAKRLQTFGEKGWSASTSSRDIVALNEEGIWELRVLGRGAAFRVLFFLDPRERRRVVVLTTCASKSSIKKAHVMTAEITRAKMRRAQWLQEEERGR